MPGSLPARPHTVLFVLSVVAFLAASVLTVVAAADTDSPEPCCAGPVAASSAPPSPSPAAPGTRAPALAQCLVGSWVTTDETLMIKFYTDVGELPMTTSGRYYEFHADGTGIERNRNVQLVGNYRGRQLRLVFNGWREFTWTATAKKITYTAITRTNLTYSYYDHRGFLETQSAEPDPHHDSVQNYSCSGGRLTEWNDGGYRSEWTRTKDYGYYG